MGIGRFSAVSAVSYTYPWVRNKASDISPNCERKVPAWTMRVSGRYLRSIGAVMAPPANKKPAGEKISAGFTRPRPFSYLFNVAASRPAQMTTG